MKFHNFGYLLKEGVKNLWKNRTMSIASIGVLISCLLLTGCASLVSINLTSMMSSIEDNNSITVYLTNGLPSLSAVQVGDQIRSIENVSECTFVPKDDGLADMMDLLGENAVVLEGLDGDENPLPDAYQISMHDLSKYDETIQQIQAIGGRGSLHRLQRHCHKAFKHRYDRARGKPRNHRHPRHRFPVHHFQYR